MKRGSKRGRGGGQRSAPTLICLALLRGLAGLAALAVAYVALVQLEVLPNPLDPTLRGDLDLARSDAAGLRVLFVGNSLTFENDMPGLLDDLAAEGSVRPRIIVASYTAPGWNFEMASQDDKLTELLRDVRWDVVVLQEASRIPSLPRAERQAAMTPYAERLVRAVRAYGAKPVFFLTWGYRDGDDKVAGDSFAAMSSRLVRGYNEEASALAAPVIPVGTAWVAAHDERPDLNLWARDGRHPSRLGSYLTASVFYFALVGEAGRTSSFFAGLPSDEATYVQRIAADAVEGARADVLTGKHRR